MSFADRPSNVAIIARPTSIFGVLVLLLTLSLCVAQTSAHAHGGVVSEEDLCLIKIGFYAAHFTIYQPISSAHEQFCEDLPQPGESIFVLEYLHDGLEKLPIDFRIIRNTTDMGTFTTWQDIEKIGNLKDLTVFYRPPSLEQDVITVLHEFDAIGEFVGIVTAESASSGTLYRAVFPFEVGFARFDYRQFAIALVLTSLLFSAVFIRHRRRRTLASTIAPGLLVLVLIAPQIYAQNTIVDLNAEISATPLSASTGHSFQTKGTYFSIAISGLPNPIPINLMHSWHLTLTNNLGVPVTSANFAISGGMPKHDHGLPSQPVVTSHLGSGVYLVQGMKFHMSGNWTLQFQIETDDAEETINVLVDI